MNEFLNEDDKEPVWDGNICLYTDSDLKSEHIQYRIPTQVKGKNDETLLRRSSITYSVKYKNLRAYAADGGVFYFVIIISDDGEDTSIFYNDLTPIKLQSLLRGKEKKKPEQTRSVPLKKLKNNDKKELYKILLQFAHDSKEQGAGELVRKAISLEDIEKIDSIRMTAFVSDRKEAIEKMTTGEACLFGHLTDTDIWLPFQYEAQKKMKLVPCIEWNETFGVDGIPYYNSFVIRQNADKDFAIQLSENLTLEIGNNKIVFDVKTKLEQVIKDIKFLTALQQGSTLYIGQKQIGKYDNINFSEGLQELINNCKQIQSAVMKFEINLGKKFSEFTDADWKAIDELLKIYRGEIKPKNETAWHIWWWQGKVVPFFLAIDANGELYVENGIHFKKICISIEGKDKRYQVPAMIMFKRDVWEKLYDVDEEILLKELEKGEFCKETEGNFSLLLIEILAAYDVTKSEKYYDLAKLISDKLLEVSPDNEYWKINKLQLLKRKRDLSEHELQELEDMEKETDDKKVICAVNILLENRRKAVKEFDAMSDEEKEMFLTYPIYNLLSDKKVSSHTEEE